MRARFEAASIKQFGRGATSTVYRATRRADGKEYAIKVFNHDATTADDRRALLRELLLLAALDHPNIVKFREAFLSSDNTVCVVMELLEGGTLSNFIRQRKMRGEHLPEEAVWALFLQLAAAVHFLHANRVCHRDLKPSNIMFASGNQARLKLVDFGLSKYMRTHLTNTTVGTPCYAAPEVFNCQPYSTACDVWSLGCILHELATLELAFGAGGMRQLRYQVLRGATEPLPPQYSQELRDTLAAMLQTNPADRITMEDLLALPHVAARLAALQQLGLVAGGAGAVGEPGSGASPIARMPSAVAHVLGRLEASPDSILSSPSSSEHTRMLSRMLPRSQYSGELSAGALAAVPVALRATPQPSQPLLPLEKTSSGSSGSVPTLLPDATMEQAQEGDSPAPCAKSNTGAALAPAGIGGERVHLHADATVDGTTTSPQPGGAARSRVKLHPKYAALVAASEAALAARSEFAAGDSSPADVLLQTDSAASGQPTSRLGGSPDGCTAGQAAETSGSALGDNASGSGSRHRPRTPGLPLFESRQAMVAAVRAAVTASIQQHDLLMVQRITERVSRLTSPTSSNGPTPRAGQGARPPRRPLSHPRGAGYQPNTTELKVQGSSPSCPALLLALPLASRPRSRDAADSEAAEAASVQQPAADSTAAAPAGVCSMSTAPAVAAADSPGSAASKARPVRPPGKKPGRVWRLVALMHRRCSQSSCIE